VALHWVGPDGIILKANRRELEILGYAHAEYVGRHISEFHVSQEATADFLKRLSGGEILENYEAQLRRKDGSIRNVVIDSSVLWDNGRFIHTRCFTTDVTERKVADKRMRILAHEVDHRARNLLALVQATVHVTQADTVRALKAAIEGRIQALSNAHTLLAQSRWAGADLRSLVTQELSPFCPVGSSRADIKGPELILKPQTCAVDCHGPA
jgi:PAS domain S-box-containing protein